MDYGGTNDFLAELSEEVKCHICLEFFTDPRMLNCSHTYCFSCLEQLSNGKNKIECPVCRQPQKLDRQGAESLPKNRYVANVVEKLKRPTTNSIPYPYSLYASTISSVPYNPQSSAPPIQESSAPLLYSALASPIPQVDPYSISNSPVPETAPSAPPLEDLLEIPSAPTLPNPPPPHISPPPANISVTSEPPKSPQPESLLTSMFSSLKTLFTGEEQQQQQQGQQSSTIQPYYALFKVPPSQIQSCFNVWAKSLWFAPSEFLNSIKFTQIQAIYTPFWIFSCNSSSNYSAQLSHYEKSTSSKKRIEVWDRSSGSLRSRHKDVIFLGDVTVSSAVQSLILEIDDWDYFKANLREPPAQTVASKIRIDRYMEMSRAWSIVSQRLVSAQQEECKKKMKKDENAEKMIDFECKVEFSEVTGQLVFLPCYIAMYSYENSEYFFVVNGQTGTTRGQRPYGLGKLGSIGKSLGGMLFGGSPKKT